MFPLSMKYGSITVSSDDGSAITHVSGNGNEWLESNAPTDTDKVTLTIEYGEESPLISNEIPADLATGVIPNPALQADIWDLQGDQVDWEIKTNASGTWQIIDSGTLTGNGTVSATPTNMDQYDTTYSWSVSAVDPNGSNQTIEEFYQFTTKLENYIPSLSNPDPPDGSVDVQLNPTLSVDVFDQDNDLMDIVFKTNASGVWTTIQAYSQVGNGSYTASPTDMDDYGTTYQWMVEVDDGRGPVSQTYSLRTYPEPGSWWDVSWFGRRQITIDHTMVETNLSDFPVLVKITDPDLTTYAQNDGDDFLFTDANSIKLSHEVVRYDDLTGELIAWVKVPNLSSVNDTTLYLYFGNSTASNQEDVAGTWDSDFVMVHHLEEPSGTHFDSTAYDNDGTTIVVTDQDATGMVSGADEFDGVDDYIRVPNASSLQFGDGSFTAEAWIYPTSVPASDGSRIVQNRGTTTGTFSFPGYQLKIGDDAGEWHFLNSGIDDGSGQYQMYTGDTTYAYNQWYQIVMIYHADNSMEFYVNSNLDGTQTVGAYGSLTNNLPTAIGGSIVVNGVEGTEKNQFFDGILDEIKLSRVARSAGWITTSYRNQNDPGTFYNIGDLEIISGPPNVSNPIPSDGAENISISTTELSFDLFDPDDDLMSYTVITMPDIGSDSVVNATNGTYSLPVSGLAYETAYTWQVSAFDGNQTTIKNYTFTTESLPAAWWDSYWPYRKRITIDHTKVTGDLINFPVFVRIDDGSLTSHIQDDADDIVFTDYDGLKLNHEIESYDPSTGILTAWVSVPYLSATTDTDLFMYYGNSLSPNQENVAAVWDTGYVIIQHMDETSGFVINSTNDSNDGETFYLANHNVAGQLNGADEFNGSSSYVRVPNTPSLQFGEGSFTAEAWIYPQTIPTSGGSRIINTRGGGGSGLAKGYQFKIGPLNGQWRFFETSIDMGGSSSGNRTYTSNTTYPYNQWYNVVMIYTADDRIDLYVNGVLDGSLAVGPFGSISNSLPTAIGASIAFEEVEGTYSQYFDGILDEIRLSNVARTSNWILTGYNNQSNPTEFYSSTAETYPGLTSNGDSTVTDFNAGSIGACLLDSSVGDGALVLNLPSSTCIFGSRIFDANEIVNWDELTFVGSAASGTSLSFDTRTSADGIVWEGWMAVNSPIGSSNGRYIQYRAILVTTDTNLSPILENVNITYTNLPTGVAVSSFSANKQNNSILLSWQSSSEVDLLGFNLYRSEADDGKQELINTSLIPVLSPGSVEGNPYQYVDTAIEPGVMYTYWLEVVTRSGKFLLGPVSAGGYTIFIPLITG